MQINGRLSWAQERSGANSNGFSASQGPAYWLRIRSEYDKETPLNASITAFGRRGIPPAPAMTSGPAIRCRKSRRIVHAMGLQAVDAEIGGPAGSRSAENGVAITRKEPSNHRVDFDAGPA